MNSELMIKESQDLAMAKIKNAAWNKLSPESQAAYNSDYEIFFDFIKKAPKDVTPSDVMDFVNDMESKKRKHRTINRRMASLSKLFKIMVLVGEMKTNPVDMLKQVENISRKPARTNKTSVTIADVKKLVKINKSASSYEKRLVMIIRCLGATGLRISAFTNIKNEDIYDFDTNNKAVDVIGKGSKERTLYIDKDFYKEIKSLFPNDEDIPYLFYNSRGHKYNRKVLWRQMVEYSEKKIDKHINPHKMRHFFATHKINVEKQDVKAVSLYLGHSSTSVTQDFYCDTELDTKTALIKI